ncbi:AzlC family ABC transporter permease [Pyxidicoccus parkwayensis]|uniref:AzlC family ABC transporter permease n=1 Tax=Pyxidicoccus parkwayensis TaxID=2813578 RepID=A0ABX7P0X9_9BACT|nr:AzlC family ABC transporter permease [Pyxidicoccus parkwaysis]QSQ24433.1 AzlC family ABC transporter permease [Pyxidicoccus parkwaysis]
MSSVDRALVRDVAAIAAAAGVIGVSFGAIAVAAGVSVWLASAMSMLVFAGGSQFMVVGVMAGGGSPVAAVLAGLLLNARHLPFGLVVSDVLGKSWPVRLLGTHLMVDESVAFALSQKDPARRRAAYWLCGLTLFVAWNVGVLVGAMAGRALGDPDALGLDAAFPAAMLALLLPSLRASPDEKASAQAVSESTRAASVARRVALVGAGIALVTTPFLPAGLPVLLALLGLAVALK